MATKQTPSEQDAYRALRGLVPIARTILDLEQVFEVGLGLKSTTAAMESRKAALSVEVADLLKKTSDARAEAALAREELSGVRVELAALRTAEQDGLHADRAARAQQDAEESKAIKARHEALAASLREERGRLTAEIEGLKQQKVALLKDLDETLTKYARR